jgi:hypothetical protein
MSRLLPADIDAACRRRHEAMHLQKIERNPLSPSEVAMFEMFEREAWPHARRRAYILAKIGLASAAE